MREVWQYRYYRPDRPDGFSGISAPTLGQSRPGPAPPPSRWPWVRWWEAFWAAVTPRQPEDVFRTGPTVPNAGWLALTRRTRVIRFIDDILVWLEAIPGGCRVHARSRSRVGRADL